VEVLYLRGDNVHILVIGAEVSSARLLWKKEKKRQVGVQQFQSGTCSWVDLMTLFNCISAITCS